MRDMLDCRSPARCATCEHFVKGVCALEAALDAALAPTPRLASIPVLSTRDVRALLATGASA